MENWYKFFKQQSSRDIKIGDYEIIYKGKHIKEDSNEPGKTPFDIHKESLKVLKNGQKVKLKKDIKQKIIEALSRENIDELAGLLPK